MHAHKDCYSQYSMIFINKTCALTSAQLFTISLLTEILSCHKNGDLKSPKLKRRNQNWNQTRGSKVIKRKCAN